MRGNNPMESSDKAPILDRILDTAADNLRIAKILVQMGLDPNDITYDALFNRLLEILLANITLANMFGLVGAAFLVATLLMHTMVPLRVANITGSAFFVAFGALSGNVRLSSISADVAHQRNSPSSNAEFDQAGTHRHEGGYFIGMAETVHDRAQISPGRQIVQEG